MKYSLSLIIVVIFLNSFLTLSWPWINVSEENDRIYYSLKLFVGNIKILDKEYSLLEKNVQIDISRPINAVSKYTVKEIKENLIKNKWKRLTKYQSSKLAEILDSENPRRIYLGLKIKDYR